MCAVNTQRCWEITYEEFCNYGFKSSKEDIVGRCVVLHLYYKTHMVNLTRPRNQVTFTFSCMLWADLHCGHHHKKHCNSFESYWKPVSRAACGWSSVIRNDIISIKYVILGTCKRQEHLYYFKANRFQRTTVFGVNNNITVFFLKREI